MGCSRIRFTGSSNINTPSTIDRGTGYCFRSISLFISLFVCLFFSFFVSKITRKRLDRFAWNFQWRCGVTMGRSDYIFGQFRETARCATRGRGLLCSQFSTTVRVTKKSTNRPYFWPCFRKQQIFKPYRCISFRLSYYRRELRVMWVFIGESRWGYCLWPMAVDKAV